MAARIVVNGRTVWADADFRKQVTERRVLRRPVEVYIPNYGNKDIDGNPLPEFIETRVPQSMPLRREFHGFDDDGRPIYGNLSLVDGIPPPVYHEPYLDGVAVVDPDENIAYRRVQEQDPKEGWATTHFWCDRWECDHEIVLKLVRRGLLDASVRAGSGIRRYRCRDERLVLESGLVSVRNRRARK